jgi:RES domain-containing protein
MALQWIQIYRPFDLSIKRAFTMTGEIAEYLGGRWNPKLQTELYERNTNFYDCVVLYAIIN